MFQQKQISDDSLITMVYIKGQVAAFLEKQPLRTTLSQEEKDKALDTVEDAKDACVNFMTKHLSMAFNEDIGQFTELSINALATDFKVVEKGLEPIVMDVDNSLPTPGTPRPARTPMPAKSLMDEQAEDAEAKAALRAEAKAAAVCDRRSNSGPSHRLLLFC